MRKMLLFAVCFFYFSNGQSQSMSIASDDLLEYNTVDLRPEFPEFSGNFMEYVSKNFSLPDYDGPTGSLKVGFIIEQNGVVSSVKVLKILDVVSTAEIKKIMAKCPKWKPAEHNGKPARVYYEFSLKLNGNS